MTEPQKPRPFPKSGIAAPNGRPFPWGPIEKVHTIGNIQIAEYLKDMSRHLQSEYWGEHGQTSYHPFIDGKDTSRSYDTLDDAVVGAIAIKRDGINTRADVYFNRMTLNRSPE